MEERISEKNLSGKPDNHKQIFDKYVVKFIKKYKFNMYKPLEGSGHDVKTRTLTQKYVYIFFVVALYW